MGTTNRPEDVEPELIRSGCSDDPIEFNPPDLETCAEILYSSLKSILGIKIPILNQI